MSGRRSPRARAAAALTIAAVALVAAPAAAPAHDRAVVPSPTERAETPRATAGDLIAAVAATGPPGEAVALPPPSRARAAWVAKLLVPAVMRARPDGGRRRWIARPQTPHSGGATRLLVLGARRDAGGRAWLRVEAPIRPNAADGWIPASAARLARTRWFASVSTGRRELRVYHGGRLRLRASVVVGAAATPTPHGLFAVYELTRQADPDAFVGPWAAHLTALSDVLDDYGGGPGRVAIHGRGQASLLDPLGSARSHGCVRADNAVLAWLRARIAPGTPVLITR